MPTAITKIEVRWDDQPGVTPAWYAEAFDEHGQAVTDSQKVAFPVDADNYDRGELLGLMDELAEEFPGVEIVVREG